MINKILRHNIRIVSRHAKLVLVLSVVLAVSSVYLATGLDLELNWVAIAPREHSAVKEYQEIMNEFPTLDNMIVVVESDDINEMSKAVTTIEKEMNQLDTYVSSVTSGLNREFLLEYSLLFSDIEEISHMMSLVSSPNYLGLYQKIGRLLYYNSDEINQYSEKQFQNEKYQLLALKKFLRVSNGYLSHTRDPEALEETLKKIMTGNTLLTSENGQMAIVTIQPSFEMMDIEKVIPGVNTIENAIQKIDREYPQVKIGVTGMHVVARDETASIQSDSSMTTFLSIGLIIFLLYFAFRAFSAPLLTFIPLLFGVIWDIGLTRIFIGRLNMITAFSAAMLIGLGIDYSIHFYSSYTESLSNGKPKEDALYDAIVVSGPGIITGAFTTAVAFFTLQISKLELLEELGVIMGMGILCTVVAVFWVLPSILYLQKEKPYQRRKIKGTYEWIGYVASLAKKKQSVCIAIILVGAIIMGYFGMQIEFDTNLMNLEPAGLESIELMNYLVEKYDMSTDSFSLQVDSLEKVYELQDSLEKISGVNKVTSIATIIPPKSIQERKIQQINAVVHQSQQNSMFPEMSISKLRDITKDNIIALEKYEKVYLKKEDDRQLIVSLRKEFDLLEDQLESAELKDLHQLNTDFMTAFSQITNKLEMPRYLTVDKLPDNYKGQYISESGESFLLRVYPNFDVWSNLKTKKGNRFFNELMSVDSSITGTPLFMKILYEAASDELLFVGSILLIILVGILLLHFRSIRYVIYVLIPLFFTLIYMVGTMQLLDIRFNMLNFLAVLLVIGIGIDDGVHIIHHYKHGNRSIYALYSSVGRAIFLTTITTMCGFGSLIFSSYRGIASLGSALVIGVGYAFVMTIVILPIGLEESSIVK